MKRVLLLLGLVVLSIVSSYSALSVNNCRSIVEGDLDPDREIILTSSFQTNGSGTCFDIEPNNILFNCQGNYIDGNETGNFVFFSNSTLSYAYDNVTFDNCEFRNSGLVANYASTFGEHILTISNSLLNQTKGILTLEGEVDLINTPIIRKQVPVSSCFDDLELGGGYQYARYYLNGDVLNASDGAMCFELSGIEFDCNGFWINATGLFGTAFQIEYGYDALITSCNIGSSRGFDALFANNISVINSNIYNSGRIDLTGVDNSTFRNLSFYNFDGFYLDSDSRDNLYEDLYLTGFGNIAFDISDNQNENNTYRNIYIENYNQGITLRRFFNTANSTFENITINSTTTGISFTGDDYILNDITIVNTTTPLYFNDQGGASELTGIYILNSYLENFSAIGIQSGNWSRNNITFQGNTFLAGTAPAIECFDIPYNTTCNTAFVPVVVSTSSTSSLFPLNSFSSIILTLALLFFWS